MGAAIIAVMLTHRFTLYREKLAADSKLAREKEVQHEKDNTEQFFLSTELIFILEKFEEECVPPAADCGDADDNYGISVAQTDFPAISFSSVKGEWRSLSPLLMYRLRELEVLLAESHNIISATFEYDDAPYFTEGFFSRRQHAARLGLRAFILSSKLRKRCGMPAMKQAGIGWSAPRLLWQQYREQRAICVAARRNGMTLGQQITKTAYEKKEREL